MQGYNTHRLATNPKEKIFAEVFQEIHGTSLFGQLKGNGTGNFNTETDEEQMGLTVIQWLGSPVGQAFLQDVEERLKQEIKKVKY